MRLPLLLVAGLLLSRFGEAAQGQASDGPPVAQQAETLRLNRLDPASPLESRVLETPASVLEMFAEEGRPTPTAHDLTEEEKHKLAAAFAVLPPLHRRILRERLQSVSFLDGMPNTALTSPVNPDDPYRLFHITIRAAILRQNASEWLTEKERSIFNATGSPLSVSIEAGKRDAIVYVLLHEATHIVDFCLGMTTLPVGKQGAGDPPPGAFSKGIWTDRTTPAPPYRDPLRERVRFRPGGEILPIDQAEAVYRSLRRTPFVSLYAGSNWYDDLAEYLAVYHWTQVLKQPFRIAIRENGKIIFVYEPMKSAVVRERIGQIKPFYSQR
jgi:hypothetical protein